MEASDWPFAGAAQTGGSCRIRVWFFGGLVWTCDLDGQTAKLIGRFLCMRVQLSCHLPKALFWHSMDLPREPAVGADHCAAVNESLRELNGSGCTGDQRTSVFGLCRKQVNRVMFAALGRTGLRVTGSEAGLVAANDVEDVRSSTT